MSEYSVDPASQDLERLTFLNGDVTLQGVAAGPPRGPVILLLHGFPEFWYSWRKQIGPLAAAGFRVVVPDQRGYNFSSKPRPVSQYSVTRLVSDILAIVEQLGCRQVFLVGHDWGAMVAWSFAAAHPAKVERLVILNGPHPRSIARFLMTRPTQLLRSWYVFFFQLPSLPEIFFSARNYQAAINSLLKTSRPGTFSQEDIGRYREAWAQPGAVRAMINWYRALFRRPAAFRTSELQVPALILWGKRDAFLLPSLAEKSARNCNHAEIIWFDDATHWLHLEEPERVNAALLQFFAN